MSKKVYKKNKKVVEKIIYQKTERKKSTYLPRYLLLCSMFFVVISFYYFNIWLLINDAVFSTIDAVQNQVSIVDSSVSSLAKENTEFIPFATNWRANLLDRKKVVTIKTKKEIVTTHTDQGSDQIIWHGPRDKKEVALTFDADMTPVMVDWLHSGQATGYDDTRITNYLTQHQIKATFFLTGLWIESYPVATKALADSSLFELENHTYSHPSMAGYCYGQPQIPVSQYPFEIEKTQQLIEQYTHQTPKYFRFSGGCYNTSDLALVKKEGLVTVHWDDVGDDGFNNDENQIITNVLSEAQNGSIIVLHMGGPSNVPQTANALPTIIEELQKKGYTFVTVNELLSPTPVVARVTPEEYLTSLKSMQAVL